MLSLYLKAFQLGQQLLSFGGGGQDQSAAMMLVSLKNIENSLVQNVYLQKQQNELLKDMPVNERRLNALTAATQLHESFSRLVEACRGRSALNKDEIDSVFDLLSRVRESWIDVRTKLVNALVAQNDNRYEFESLVVPTLSTIGLGLRLGELLAAPSTVLDLLNRDRFRTGSGLELPDADNRVECRDRLHMLAQSIRQFFEVIPGYEQDWQKQAGEIGQAVAIRDDRTAVFPIVIVATRFQPTQPGSLSPGVIMRIVWRYDIVVFSDGYVSEPQSPSEEISFHKVSTAVLLDRERTKLERVGEGRKLRLKSGRFVIFYKPSIIEAAKKNKRDLSLKGDLRNAAYKLAASLDRDREAILKAKFRGTVLETLMTWDQLLNRARIETNRLGFVRRGAVMLREYEADIERRSNLMREIDG